MEQVKQVRQVKLKTRITIIAIIVACALAYIITSQVPRDEDSNLLSTEEMLEVAREKIDEHMNERMSGDTPESERIISYSIDEIRIIAGDEKEFCAAITFEFTQDGMYPFSNGGQKDNKDGTYTWFDCYQEFRIKSNDRMEYKIISIGTGGGAQGLAPILIDN
jgi:hypothetical protein